jgi:hypothetical protein
VRVGSFFFRVSVSPFIIIFFCPISFHLN